MFKLRSVCILPHKTPFGSLHYISRSLTTPKVKHKSINNTRLVSEAFAFVELNNPDKALDKLQALVSKKARIQINLCESLITCFAKERGMDKATTWIGTIFEAYAKGNYVTQRSSLPHFILDLTRKHEMKLENMLKIHDFMVPVNVLPSAEVASALLQKYEQTRNDSKAWSKVSNKLTQQSFFLLYRSLFVNTCRSQEFGKWSLSLLDDMRSLGFEPNLQQYNRVLGRLKRSKDFQTELAWREAHGNLLAKTPGTSIDRITGLALESVYENRFEEAVELMREAVEKGDGYPNITAIASVMEYSRHQQRHDVVKKIYDMVCSTIVDLPLGYRKAILIKVSNSAITSFAQQKKHVEALECFEHMRKIDTMPSSDAYASLLMNVLDKDIQRLYNLARGYYKKFTPYFFNVVISRFARSKEYKKSILVYEDMLASQIKPNGITYGSLISACVRCRAERPALLYFDEMLKANMINTSAIHLMMSFYQRKKDIVETERFFRICKEHDLKPTQQMYKTLIEVYAPTDVERAHRVISEMTMDNVEPTANHYAVLINAYGVHRHDLHSALMIYDEMVAAKIEPDDNLFQVMASAYSKNGCPDKAQEYRFKVVGS
ncbi:hypothetical protein BY458DRAFT_529069 [Sporodiniella umbellata]|nr:hypothetical protein BY458DRAFT_529069 [Sporodiniella umbellata]